MTQPNRSGPSSTPLQWYARVQLGVDRELAAILRDAAREAERLYVKLGERENISAQSTRSQIGVVLRELRAQQADMWGYVTRATRSGMERAAVAAVDSESWIERFLFSQADLPPQRFIEGLRASARRGVLNIISRGANNIPLSRQVYRTRALSNGWVDRTINRGILLRKSARQIARDVRRMINPDVRGGVSYAAFRMARTELNNAFHRTQIEIQTPKPWISGMRWNLSRSHPRPDECDTFARTIHYVGGDPGVYRKEEVPRKPHPQCFCYLTSEDVGEAEFINAIVRGDREYERYLDSVL